MQNEKTRTLRKDSRWPPQESRIGCEWVRKHLCEYHALDMEPAELEAIDEHLRGCSGCTEEWRRTEAVLARIESASPIARQLKSVSSDEFLAGVIARIDRYESERARKTQPRWRRIRSMLSAICPTIRIRRFAAVALMVISISALAYLSPMVVNYMTGANQAAFGSREVTATNSPEPQSVVAAGIQGVRPLVKWPARVDTNIGIKLPWGQEFLKTDMDGRIEEIVAEAQVEAMLPHTEAEWEAWARKEYPHVMWVYDVLTKPEYGINWDGKPAYIPEWAKRIWTDEATRPTGWRALVFYSGEIAKFDYPIKPEDPNVRPTIEITKLAAVIAGFELRVDGTGKLELPKLEYADLNTNSPSHAMLLASLAKKMDGLVVIKKNENRTKVAQGYSYVLDYAAEISRDRTKRDRTLIFIAETSHCISGPRFDQLEDISRGMLGKSRKVPCSADEIRMNIQSIMIAQEGLLMDIRKGWNW